MKKLIYLTTNPYKVEEANKFFKEKYGFNIEMSIKIDAIILTIIMSITYAKNLLYIGCFIYYSSFLGFLYKNESNADFFFNIPESL